MRQAELLTRTVPEAIPEAIRYFVPGPAYVLLETREAMLAPMAGHRSASFRALYDRLASRLGSTFRTARDVPFATGSATLVMEIAVASTVRRDVLHLISGSFSERWFAISRSRGLEADRLEVPWGQPVDPELVRRALRRKRYEAVTVVHSETSTGTLNPIAEIAEVVRRESDALVLVDAVSSLGGVPVETDAWGLDLVLTGSQKALAAPPGLVPFAVSARAEERAATVPNRGFYTDVLRYLEYHRDGGPITTPALPVCHALDHQLARIASEGLENRWARHRRQSDRVAEWARDHGFRFGCEEAARSPTVSCLVPPAGVAPKALVGRLAERGFTVAGGYGAWKETTFRIGHMGEIADTDLEALLTATAELV